MSFAFLFLSLLLVTKGVCAVLDFGVLREVIPIVIANESICSALSFYFDKRQSCATHKQLATLLECFVFIYEFLLQKRLEVKSLMALWIRLMHFSHKYLSTELFE